MVSLAFQPEYISSPPRISFSADFLEDSENSSGIQEKISIKVKKAASTDEIHTKNVDFEFLSSCTHKMLSADELFSDGKLLPYWKTIHQMERLSIQTKEHHQHQKEMKQQSSSSCIRISEPSWFLDDDPSPRPPKCTVLWKELLRLKKNKPHSSLSASSSSSSTSSSSSSMAAASAMDPEKKESNLKSRVKRIHRVLERTTSSNIRIRPLVNVPACTKVKSGLLPPVFPRTQGRVLL